MSNKYTWEENTRRYDEIKVALEVKGDGKCYFPCNDCRGLQTRILLRKTIEINCKEKGHAEGGYEYHPLVRFYSLLNVLLLIVLIMYSQLFFIILNICVVYYTLMLLYCL